MAAIVAVIGLELAQVAAKMAGLLPQAGQVTDNHTLIVSMLTFAISVFGAVLFRGFIALIAILAGLLVG